MTAGDSPCVDTDDSSPRTELCLSLWGGPPMQLLLEILPMLTPWNRGTNFVSLFLSCCCCPSCCSSHRKAGICVGPCTERSPNRALSLFCMSWYLRSQVLYSQRSTQVWSTCPLVKEKQTHAAQLTNPNWTAGLKLKIFMI